MKYSPDQSDTQSNSLPDVALESSTLDFSALPWVGMSCIEALGIWQDTKGSQIRIPCRVEAQVSLDLKASRGIHMSRLYLIVQEVLARSPLSLKSLQMLNDEFLETHQDLSQRARVAVALELPVERKALKSEYSGWRNYPIVLSAQSERTASGHAVKLFAEVRISYSSTCPASAALSRQILSEDFLKAFPQGADPQKIAAWLQSNSGMPATPHAQRSEARVIVELQKDSQFQVLDLINLIENTLQTPVQAAVKREDEQEFARRNSQNLMFCEDAARRVQKAFAEQSALIDYYGQFEHFESLHPHNAISFIQKTPQGLNSFTKTSFSSHGDGRSN